MKTRLFARCGLLGDLKAAQTLTRRKNVDSVPKLPERYLEDARRMTAAHIVKKNCKNCYGRGYRGVNQHNMLVTCSKCVDEEALFEDWKAFVRETPELSEIYGDYYEEEESEEESDAEESPEDKA